MSINVGDAFIKLGLDKTAFDKQMTGLKGTIQQHSKQIGMAMTAAGGAILAAGALSVKTYAEMGDEVQKMALRTGFSTEALSELRYAAELSGTNLEGLDKAVKRMSGTILDAQDGMETYVRAFEHIGIKVEELEGLNPEEQFLKIALAIADVEDPMKRAALAQDMFGRSGTELLPMLANGAAGVNELREAAHKFAPIFDQEAANAAANFNDRLADLTGSVDKVKFEIADKLIPILIPLIEKIRDIISGISAWMNEHPALTRVIVLTSGALGALMLVLGPMLIMLPGLTAAVGAFRVMMRATQGPVGIIILAITALVAAGIALWKNWDTVVAFFKKAWINIKLFFLQGVDNILATLHKFTSWIPGLGKKIDEARDKISGMINAEKVERDSLAVQESIRELQEAAKKGADTIETTLAPALGESIPEAANKADEAMSETAKVAGELAESVEDLREQFEYERSEAGKLRVSIKDVTFALFDQGWTVREVTDVFNSLGGEADNVNSVLDAVGLTAADVTKILAEQAGTLGNLADKYNDVAGAAGGMLGIDQPGQANKDWASGVQAQIKVDQLKALGLAKGGGNIGEILGLLLTNPLHRMQGVGIGRQAQAAYGMKIGEIMSHYIGQTEGEDPYTALIRYMGKFGIAGATQGTANITINVGDEQVARIVGASLVNDITLSTGLA